MRADALKFFGFLLVFSAVISGLSGKDFFEPAALGLLLMILGHVVKQENSDERFTER